MPKKIFDTLYEGGDDYNNADVDAPPKSRADKKKDKYGGDVDNFSVANNSKITDGIVTDRGCTDMICLVIFIAFLVGMFSVTSYCFAEGDVSKYLAPVAPYSSGLEICGYGDQKSNPYLVFDLSDPTYLQHPFDHCSCQKECDQYSHAVGKYCVPYFSGPHMSSTMKTGEEVFKKAFTASLESNAAGKQIMDLYKSSTAIYIACAAAIIFCFAYIYLMSYFAEQIAWTIIGITQVSLYVGCCALIFEYLEVKNSTNSLKKESANAFLVGGIVSGLAAIIFTIMLVCGFNQLKIAIDVVDAAADFIRKTKRIILVPVVYFFIQIIVILTWFFAIICIQSIGTITPTTAGDNQIKNVQFDGKYSSGDVYILYMVMFFGLLWILAFFNAQQSMIVMVSGCSYYFDSNKDKDGYADVSTGIKLAWVNHVGSLALGSFIIAVVEFLRIVVAVIAEQAQKASGNNPAVKCIVCVANCFMACLEKIVDYINKSAYAYMAVSGDSFCTAAWNGFLLNMKHALEFAWANTLAQLFILTGKISLVAVNCAFLYFTMKFITGDLSGDDAVSSPWGPIVLVALITFVAASVFLGLFSNTVLSLMTCLSIDTDLNGDPKYGPPTFHDFQRDFKEKRNAIADGGWEKKDAENTAGDQPASNQVA